jgi:hypothetical protein
VEVRTLVAKLFAEDQHESALGKAQYLWHHLPGYSEGRTEQIDEIVGTVVPPEQIESFMSTAEALIEKGIAQGIQHGLVRAKQDDVVEVIEICCGHLPSSVREAIEAILALNKLSALHKRAILCTSLAEFEDALRSLCDSPQGDAKRRKYARNRPV